MNISETSNALALAQAYDNRTVGEMNVRAWHAILGDLGAADVMEAIRRHYAETDAWVMPAHIRRAVADIELERARAARRWAPGQAGVAPEDALPELPGPLTESQKRSWREVLESLGVRIPDGSREALMPRTVAWEREQRAFLRTHDGEPNPLYRPSEERECVVVGDEHCQTHNRHVSWCPAAKDLGPAD